MDYLWKVADLDEKAIFLGNMREKPYAGFLAQAQEQAAEAGITKVKLGLGLRFKPGHPMGQSDSAYPPMEEEWDLLVSQIDEYCTEEPRVYLVDGDKYHLPI